MAEAIHQSEQEFWRPPAQAPAVRVQAESCARCGAEFVMGGRFCHVCGMQREPLLDYTGHGLSRWLDFHQIKAALGLSTGSLVAFIVGIACVIAAVVTGLIYTATTVLDWQAVQIWRIEWLLAAAAAFLAGILLNKKEA